MSVTVTEYGIHNQGLFTLSPPQNDWEKRFGAPNLDVVAVHGLNGECFRSWTHVEPNGDKTMWLNEQLLYKRPRTRAMTFGYNASVVGNTSVAGIRDNARQLLTFLRNKREEDGTFRRPVVFVGHSLGGIIIKQALRIARNEQRNFGHVADSTKGIVFFGTPHRGTDAATWGEVIAGIKAASFGTRPKTSFFKMLRPNSQELMDLSEDFRSIAQDYAIVSFIEGDTFRKLGRVIVPKHSAVLELTHEHQLLLAGDHSTIVKFSRDPADANRLDAVLKGIKLAARGPETPSIPFFNLHVAYNANQNHDGNRAQNMWNGGGPGQGTMMGPARLERSGNGGGGADGRGMLPWAVAGERREKGVEEGVEVLRFRSQ